MIESKKEIDTGQEKKRMTGRKRSKKGLKKGKEKKERK